MNLTDIVTPVRVNILSKLYNETHYDNEKARHLIQGFTNGFSIGYEGPENIRQYSPNLKLTVGSKYELWNKVMGEVAANRFAGPFEWVPFDYFIQSPIGLVPKDQNKTRLIFHLSYPKNSDKSVNSNTPDNLRTVHYPDFDKAVRLCLTAMKLGIGECYFGKSDMTGAFRHLPIRPDQWRYLVMKALSPVSGRWLYFVDKCLPFGSAASCKLFQDFSDSISHIMFVKTGFLNLNYLDDFFFVTTFEVWCNNQIQAFLSVCEAISFPVSQQKTVWACQLLIFLGLLLDSKNKRVSIPYDKIQRARLMVMQMKGRKKTTLRELQKLCGFFNFLCKCVVPGRVFLRRMYSFGSKVHCPNHHISVTREFRLDLEAWLQFLNHTSVFSRSMFEFDLELTAKDIEWYTDAAKSRGLGGICGQFWFIGEWEDEFLLKANPSINYLELFAVAASILSWSHMFKNQNINLFCDNMSVVHMLNSQTSKCKNCMVLLRLIVLQGMVHNVRIHATHIKGVLNNFSDLLSRLEHKKFRQLARARGKVFNKTPSEIPEEIWPVKKIWIWDDNSKQKSRKIKSKKSKKGVLKKAQLS